MYSPRSHHYILDWSQVLSDGFALLEADKPAVVLALCTEVEAFAAGRLVAERALHKQASVPRMTVLDDCRLVQGGNSRLAPIAARNFAGLGGHKDWSVAAADAGPLVRPGYPLRVGNRALVIFAELRSVVLVLDTVLDIDLDFASEGVASGLAIEGGAWTAFGLVLVFGSASACDLALEVAFAPVETPVCLEAA